MLVVAWIFGESTKCRFETRDVDWRRAEECKECDRIAGEAITTFWRGERSGKGSPGLLLKCGMQKLKAESKVNAMWKKACEMRYDG